MVVPTASPVRSVAATPVPSSPMVSPVRTFSVVVGKQVHLLTSNILGEKRKDPPTNSPPEKRIAVSTLLFPKRSTDYILKDKSVFAKFWRLVS